MPEKTTSLITFAFIAGLAACSSDNNTNSDNASTSGLAPGEPPTETVTMDGLAGQWSFACSPLATSAEFQSAELSVANNVATLTESFYTDSGCTTAAVPAMAVTDHSLVFDNTITNTSLGEASNVESTVESKSIDGTFAAEDTNVVTHDIMLITNNTLYFGDKTGNNNGSSDALRPQTLDQASLWSNL